MITSLSEDRGMSRVADGDFSETAQKRLEKAYVEAAVLEAAEIVLREGRYTGEEFCRKIWTTQKRILKDRYNIDWDSPFQ